MQATRCMTLAHATTLHLLLQSVLRTIDKWRHPWPPALHAMTWPGAGHVTACCPPSRCPPHLGQASLHVFAVAEGAALTAQQQLVEQLHVDKAEQLLEQRLHQGLGDMVVCRTATSSKISNVALCESRQYYTVVLSGDKCSSHMHRLRRQQVERQELYIRPVQAIAMCNMCKSQPIQFTALSPRHASPPQNAYP